MGAVGAYQATHETPLSTIPPDKVKLITDFVVAACNRVRSRTVEPPFPSPEYLD